MVAASHFLSHHEGFFLLLLLKALYFRLYRTFITIWNLDSRQRLIIKALQRFVSRRYELLTLKPFLGRVSRSISAPTVTWMSAHTCGATRLMTLDLPLARLLPRPDNAINDRWAGDGHVLEPRALLAPTANCITYIATKSLINLRASGMFYPGPLLFLQVVNCSALEISPTLWHPYYISLIAFFLSPRPRFFGG